MTPEYIMSANRLPALENYYQGPKLKLPSSPKATAKHKADSGDKKAAASVGGKGGNNKYSTSAHQLWRKDDDE